MSGSAAAPGLLSLLCHTTYTGHTVYRTHDIHRTQHTQDTALTGERQRPSIVGLSIVPHVMKFLANAKQIRVRQYYLLIPSLQSDLVFSAIACFCCEAVCLFIVKLHSMYHLLLC